MSTDSTGYRVRRALSADELAHIHTEITAARNTTDLLMRVFRAVFTPLLADLGATLDDINEDNKLRTGQYAVPTSQCRRSSPRSPTAPPRGAPPRY